MAILKSLLLFLFFTFILSSALASSSEREREREGEGSEQQEGSSNNPFFFGRDSFRHPIKTQHGAYNVLEAFHERSKLLSGLANHRLAILEADPNTFVLPAHIDAEAVYFVLNGRGVVSEVREERRESREIRQGDIIRVRAGAIVYIINKDRSEKLSIAKLLQPVSVPGQLQIFHDAGGKDPETYYLSFSNDVLEAAFNTPRERLERVFGKQNKGAITKVTEKQIKAMSHSSSSSSSSSEQEQEQEGSRRLNKFNLFDKRPSHANNRGQLYEADSNDHRELRDLDVQVTFANISAGSMLAPSYNSRAIKVTLVWRGRGFVETVTPDHYSRHQSQSQKEGQQGQGQEEREQQQQQQEGQGQGQEQQQEEREQQQEGQHQQQEGQGQGQQHGQGYKRFRSNLSPGNVFVSLPGHPETIISSRDDNLQLLSFEINAHNNERIFVAGKNNPLRQLEREAIELAFGQSEQEVRRVLDAQKEKVFLPGPQEDKQQQEEGRGFARI